MDKLVTIASFPNPEATHVMSAKLESFGVLSFVSNQNYIISYAVGRVKLQVRESDVEEARRVLNLKE
jgi:hypothetical protein